MTWDKFDAWKNKKQCNFDVTVTCQENLKRQREIKLAESYLARYNFYSKNSSSFE